MSQFYGQNQFGQYGGMPFNPYGGGFGIMPTSSYGGGFGGGLMSPFPPRFPSPYRNPYYMEPVYGGGMGQVRPTNIPFRDPGYGSPMVTQNLIQSLGGPQTSFRNTYRPYSTLGMLDRFRGGNMGSPFPMPYPQMPSPGGKGALKAMDRAIVNAGLNIDQVDYINAHGTSTPFNDKNESQAIQNLFKEHSKIIKVSSTKSMTGHLLGAAGGIEAVALVKSINDQKIPPTINYETPDTDCTLDYVPNHAQDYKITSALSNTFGFGGHNAVICLKKYC